MSMFYTPRSFLGLYSGGYFSIFSAQPVYNVRKNSRNKQAIRHEHLKCPPILMPFGPSWTCCFLRLYHDSESQIGTRTERLKPLPIIPDRGLRQLLADALSYSHWLSMVCVLKGRLLKNLLVFLRKIEDLTFFFHRLPPNRGEKGKNSLFWPRQTPSAKIGYVGVYFAKTWGKIEDGFTDIFRFQSWKLVFGRNVILLGFNNY